MKRPTQQGHDSTWWRQRSYSICRGFPVYAQHCMKIADRMEAMEPREWQPAGTMPIRELVKRVK